jgi:hypothetical protein
MSGLKERIKVDFPNEKFHRHPSGTNMVICVDNFSLCTDIDKSLHDEGYPLFGERYLIRDLILSKKITRMYKTGSDPWKKEIIDKFRVRIDGFILKKDNSIFEDEKTWSYAWFVPDNYNGMSYCRHVLGVDINNSNSLAEYRKKLYNSKNIIHRKIDTPF